MADGLLHIESKEFLEVSEEILEKGKQFSFMARGKSMSPFIREDDTVVISPISGSIGVGDIVLAKTNQGAPVLHRIIKFSPTGVVTKGDAAQEDDGFIPAENVLGKVVQVSGEGFNFHLNFPFKYFITKRNFFEKIFRRFPILKKTLKKILRVPPANVT